MLHLMSVLILSLPAFGQTLIQTDFSGKWRASAKTGCGVYLPPSLRPLRNRRAPSALPRPSPLECGGLAREEGAGLRPPRSCGFG